MGRTNEGRRLADPVFNMADELMADFSGNADSENRPFHAVYLRHKLPCPHISSRSEAGKVWGFLQRMGSRSISEQSMQELSSMKYPREAWQLFTGICTEKRRSEAWNGFLQNANFRFVFIIRLLSSSFSGLLHNNKYS